MRRTHLIVVGILLASAAKTPAADPVHDVPETIDATGKTEVSTALMKWLAKLPPAKKEAPATVRFARGGTYWVDYTILMGKRGTGGFSGTMWHDLPEFSLDHFRFDLNGAVLEQRSKTPYKQAGKVADERKRWGAPILVTQGATNIQIYGGTIRGPLQQADYHPAYEEWTGIRITGNPHTHLVEDVVVRDMTIENVYGDYIYLASPTTAGGQLKNVRIENNVMRVAGRQGIVLNGGTKVVIKGNTFGATARFLFDSEPTAAQGWSDVTIDGNTGTSGKLGFFQFTGPKAVVAEKLTITNNVLKGGHFKIRLANGNPDARREGFTFTNNVATEGANPFGGVAAKKAAHLIEVTRWKDVVITGNTEYFGLVNGKPFHTAVILRDVENSKVSDNKWTNASDGK
jgi:hypothetical protein